MYSEVILPFPCSPRDQLMKRFIQETPDFVLNWQYSIERKDVPLRPGIIRSHVPVCGLYIRRETQTTSKFSFVYQADLKGSIPSWILNGAGKDFLKFLKRIEKAIDQKRQSKKQ
jgi:hypothetical protein